MLSNSEHKRLLLEKITEEYRSEGPLPLLEQLHHFISCLNPQEFAKAIYMLESKEDRYAFLYPQGNKLNLDEEKIIDSRQIKEDLGKIFIAVAEHFRRMPNQAEPTVDILLKYLQQALVLFALTPQITNSN